MKPGVDTAQTTWELEQMLKVFEQIQPRTVLEIGIWKGGTLWHWLEPGDITVVAVDDTMRDPGPDVWQEWANQAGSTLHLIKGSSQDQMVVEDVAAFAPFQFALIDGDHTYESVKEDWLNYGPMVDGVVCFHDIVPRPGYGVSELWGEIQAEYRTVEFIDGTGVYNGIGVVYL